MGDLGAVKCKFRQPFGKMRRCVKIGLTIVFGAFVLCSDYIDLSASLLASGFLEGKFKMV
jgi:hypothetical protein